MIETKEKRVLLVEDDRFLRRACEASLRQLGLVVLTAVDGAAGEGRPATAGEHGAPPPRRLIRWNQGRRATR